MKITQQQFHEKFNVIAGLKLNCFDGDELETLVLCFEDKEVKLNKDECKELMSVLKGKKSSVSAFEDEKAYAPHSEIRYSVFGNKPVNVVVYTEKYISAF